MENSIKLLLNDENYNLKECELLNLISKVKNDLNESKDKPKEEILLQNKNDFKSIFILVKNIIDVIFMKVDNINKNEKILIYNEFNNLNWKLNKLFCNIYFYLSLLKDENITKNINEVKLNLEEYYNFNEKIDFENINISSYKKCILENVDSKNLYFN